MSLLVEYSPTLHTEAAMAIGKNVDEGIEAQLAKKERLEALAANDAIGNKKAVIESGYDSYLLDPTLSNLKEVPVGEGEDKKSIFGTIIKYRKAIYL